MNYTIDSSWLPKEGNTLLEYEDALYPKITGSFEKEYVTVAVSDGASESMLSGKWAELLVRLCCKKDYCLENFNLFLNRSYRGWELWKRAYITTRIRDYKPIQWYEEPGLNKGAFASLLCLKLDNNNKWNAIALGDSCLFQVRDNTVITSFPIASSNQFGNRPYLLSSNPTNNTDVLKYLKKIAGQWKKNDSFFLMTDALAAWFLKQLEDGETPWISILDADTEEYEQPLGKLVQYLRKRGTIQNDDVSVIRLDLR
jgi:hypothetical protein